MKVLQPITITDSNLDSTNVAEPSGGDPAVYNGGTTYNTGDEVFLASTHTIYRSVQDSNTGNDPEADAGSFRDSANKTNTWWTVVSATNQFKMFDEFNNSQTTNADTIDTEVTLGQITPGVAVLNVDANTVQVIVDDPTEGVVYDRTVSLISNSGITDWWAYYFTPIERVSDVVLVDLPSYKDASIQVIIDRTGDTAACGVLAFGTLFNVGTTLEGVQASILDFSRKEQDEFGNFTVLQRGFSKRREYDVLVQTGRTGLVENYLTSIRTTPVIWIGEEDYDASIAYGYYRDFTIILSANEGSTCSVRVEGLT